MIAILTLAATVATLIAVIPVFLEAVVRLRVRRAESAPRQVDFRTFETDVLRNMPVGRGQTPPIQDPFRLGLADGGVLFVVPTVPRVSSEGTAVPLEDVRAVEQILGVARHQFPDAEERFDVEAAGDVCLPHGDNMIVIGSSFANPVTAALLTDPHVGPMLGVRFEEDGGLESRRLIVDDQEYLSPYASQAQHHQTDPGTFTGGFEDFGVIARVPNPWHPERTVLLIAGIRALGTWGAAWHLRYSGKELARLVGDGPFIVVVKTYRESPFKNFLITNVVYSRAA